jgi:hypothetical protein
MKEAINRSIHRVVTFFINIVSTFDTIDTIDTIDRIDDLLIRYFVILVPFDAHRATHSNMMRHHRTHENMIRHHHFNENSMDRRRMVRAFRKTPKNQ